MLESADVLKSLEQDDALVPDPPGGRTDSVLKSVVSAHIAHGPAMEASIAKSAEVACARPGGTEIAMMGNFNIHRPKSVLTSEEWYLLQKTWRAVRIELLENGLRRFWRLISDILQARWCAWRKWRVDRSFCYQSISIG